MQPDGVAVKATPDRVIAKFRVTGGLAQAGNHAKAEVVACQAWMSVSTFNAYVWAAPVVPI